MLITGAARGLGRAQAERFARESATVIVTDVDAPSLELAVREMRAEGLDVSGRELDGPLRDLHEGAVHPQVHGHL